MNKELTAEVKKFIDEHPLAVISINQPGKSPYSAAIFVVPDSDLNLYFITKIGTHKYQALQQDDQVAITIADFRPPKTLQATGTASELTAEGALAERVFQLLSTVEMPGNPGWLPPIAKINAGEYAIFEIKPDWMRVGDFSSNPGSEKQPVFQEVIG